MTCIAVVGSRDFQDYALLCCTLDKIRARYPDCTLVSGGAQGADTLASQYSQEHGIPIRVFWADWNRYGKAAGPIRNREIVEAADIVVAFWDGKSRGTKSTISIAKSWGRKVQIVRFNQPTGMWGEPALHIQGSSDYVVPKKHE
jgi:hypothetical protein